MSENNVFEYILQNSEPGEYSGTQILFPSLKTKCRLKIVRRIADVICFLPDEKSTSAKEYRLKILQFLLSLGCIKSTHLTINSDYYFWCCNVIPCFCSNDSYVLVLKRFQNTGYEFYQRKNREIMKSKDTRRLKQMKLHVLIKGNKSEKCFAPIFKYDIQTPTIMNEINSSLLVIISKNEDKSPNGYHSETYGNKSLIYRQKQISFAYTILDKFEHQDLAIPIAATLHSLSSYRSLEPFETSFIEYIWCNAGNFKLLKSDIVTILLQHFEFIMEKMILYVSTKILATDCVVKSDVIDTLRDCMYFESLKHISGVSEALGSKIRDILFELYSFSGCNKNILLLIHTLK